MRRLDVAHQSIAQGPINHLIRPVQAQGDPHLADFLARTRPIANIQMHHKHRSVPAAQMHSNPILISFRTFHMRACTSSFPLHTFVQHGCATLVDQAPLMEGVAYNSIHAPAC